MVVVLKRRQRILIVDDDALVRDTIADILSDAGYQAVIAASWDMGETGFEGIGYSLVITDIFMPGRGGLEVIDDVRKKWPGVKILAISGGWGGTSAEEAIEAASRMGADTALSKPFEQKDLMEKVVELIGEA
ncbi:MAG: response regulator [Rhodospirillales bacterium]|nr:response regulator [Rhodospirillales bacterium]